MEVASDRISFVPFTLEHLDGAVALSRQVSWPHGRDDWALVADLSTGVAATSGRTVIGTALCTPFDDATAALNMIVVDAHWRGRGLGRRLMQEVMALAGERAMRLVATEDGRPLYEKLGFVAVGGIAQHQGIVEYVQAPRIETVTAEPEDLAEIVRLDAEAFGADRSALLSRLMAKGKASLIRRQDRLTGFAFCRPFGRGHVVGPVVAHERDEAKALIATHAAAHRGGFLRVDTPGHSRLEGWLAEQGMVPSGGGTVMVRGTLPAPSGGPATFALASQALG